MAADREDGADRRTRAVRNLVEPVAGVAFFAPEVHARYESLGFPNPGGERDGVRMFDWPVYFAARAACMGPVEGRIAAAAFGVFPTARVADAVNDAWTRVGPEELLSARLTGTVAALDRLLVSNPRYSSADLDWAIETLDRGLEGAPTDGCPLFAGLRSLTAPDEPLGRWWRLCDQYREHRMDVHVNAMTEAGLNGCEACLLNDARQGLGLGSYVVTRGWTAEQIEAGVESLRGRGLVDDVGLTDEGRRFRERLEGETDRGQVVVIEAMGGDAAVEDLDARIGWQRQAIIDGFGYPGRRFVENTAERARG